MNNVKELIITTAEQAIEKYKIELMKEINILLDESKKKEILLMMNVLILTLQD